MLLLVAPTTVSAQSYDFEGYGPFLGQFVHPCTGQNVFVAGEYALTTSSTVAPDGTPRFVLHMEHRGNGADESMRPYTLNDVQDLEATSPFLPPFAVPIWIHVAGRAPSPSFAVYAVPRIVQTGQSMLEPLDARCLG